MAYCRGNHMDLLPIFGSRMKSLEILSLLQGFKPVVRQGFYESELKQVEQFCQDHNLVLVKSNFKVVPLDTSTAFLNKGVSTSIEDPRPGFLFVYISKTQLGAHKAALAELYKDHVELGKLLGYPECCGRFLAEHEPVRMEKDNDFEVPVLENSSEVKYSFWMNIFKRSQDACVLSHFPCSLLCSESLVLAQKYWGLLENNDKSWADDWKKKLSGSLAIHGRSLVFA